MEIEVKGESEVFGVESGGEKQVVWMSHGDEAVKLPQGFVVVAQSAQDAVAALENREKKIYGLQYHPETVRVDAASNKLTLIEFMDPVKVTHKLENKCKKKVELVSPKSKKETKVNNNDAKAEKQSQTMVKFDKEKDLVTVTGTMEVKDVTERVKRKLKKKSMSYMRRRRTKKARRKTFIWTDDEKYFKVIDDGVHYKEL